MSKRRRNRSKLKEPRNMVVVGMILTCRSKRWDARQRRSKDARRQREWKERHET